MARMPLPFIARAKGCQSILDAFAWRARIASPKDEAAFIAWAQGAEAAGQALSRAIIVDGALAGCASLYAPHPGDFPDILAPTLQMGYWEAREFRGQGLSWRAMASLPAFGRAWSLSHRAGHPRSTLRHRCRHGRSAGPSRATSRNAAPPPPLRLLLRKAVKGWLGHCALAALLNEMVRAELLHQLGAPPDINGAQVAWQGSPALDRP